jgi:hypothetical protein
MEVERGFWKNFLRWVLFRNHLYNFSIKEFEFSQQQKMNSCSSIAGMLFCDFIKPSSQIHAAVHWKSTATLRCVTTCSPYLPKLNAQEEECESLLLLCPTCCPFWFFPSVCVVLQVPLPLHAHSWYRCQLVELWSLTTCTVISVA